MRKVNIVFSIFSLLLGLVSCDDSLKAVDDNAVVSEKNTIRIRVSLPKTRAVINDTGSGKASFSWENGDDIGVVVDGHLYQFVLSGLDDDNTGSFMAELPVGSTVKDGALIAYPYVSEDFNEGTGIFYLTFPTEYSTTKESDFRHRWAGKLRKGNHDVYYADLAHQTAILRVTYDGVPLSANSVQLTADINIAGNSKTVTNHFSWHDDLMNFYFPIPEGIYHSFTVSLRDEDGEIEKTRKTLSGSNMSLETGKIYRTPSISLYEKDFSVDLHVAYEGFDGEKSWFQPRIAWTGNSGEYTLIMQPWYISQSDLFGVYHEMKSFDGGLSWSNPYSLEEYLGDRYEDEGNVVVRIADVNTQHHYKSNRILAIGGVVRYKDWKQTSAVKQTCYFSFNPLTNSWSDYKVLTMPNLSLFDYSYPGCSQWVELPNGDILQPFRMWDNNTGQFSCTVARCSFDGNDLNFVEYGNVLNLDREDCMNPH